MNAVFNGADLLPTRRSLLTRLKDWGDQDGWQEFFDTYWRLIYSVAVKAGLTDNEAQEVVQETMVQVAKAMPGFQYDPAVGSFKAWLLHTTRWKIAAQFKRRRRERRQVHLPDQDDAHTNGLDCPPELQALDWNTLWEAEWEHNLFEAALDKVKLRVSPRQFEIFYLRVLKGQPVKQVADALEVNAGQVYLATYRVGRALKREIQRLQSVMVGEGLVRRAVRLMVLAGFGLA